MNEYYPEAEQPGGADLQATARRFEQQLSAGESVFLDFTTVDELFEFYRLNEKWEEAEQLLEFGFDHYPFHAELYFKKAVLLAESDQEDYKSALAVLETALQLCPQRQEYRLMQTRLLALNNQSADALELLHEILETNPRNPDVLLQLAMVSQSLGKFQLAIEQYRAVLELNPQSEDALYELVHCYEYLGQYAEGIAFCESLLDQHPYTANAWYNLGLLRHKRGEWEQAVWAFDFALLIEEDFTLAHYAKALAHIELEQYGQAVRTLLNSLHFERTDLATLLCLGECLEQLQQYTRARFYYKQCTDIYSELPYAWYGIGSTLEAENRYYEALHYYRKSIELSEDYLDAWLGMADCEYNLGNEVSAVEALRKCVELAPDDLDLWKDWAARFDQDGRGEAALEWLREGQRLNPGQAALLYQYAAYAFKYGRREEAQQMLENALLLDPSTHRQLYEVHPDMAHSAQVQQLIAQYRP